MALERLTQLPALIGKYEANVIVETPKGSRNKFNFDSQSGLFCLGTTMPLGVTFPFEFGFLPSTLGEDGDPLDVLILMDAPTFVGCLVDARLIGVLEIRQTKKGKELRNDRIIAVAKSSRRHSTLHTLRDVPAATLEEMEHFFASYNEIKGEKLKVIGRHGPARAVALVRSGVRAALKRGGVGLSQATDVRLSQAHWTRENRSQLALCHGKQAYRGPFPLPSSCFPY